MTGCTNPKAKNYNPSATQDDGSCVYLVEVNGQCKEFGDIPNQDELKDTSFTLSFSIPENNWAFFHDYFPDYYFHTRKHLFNFKDGKIYQNNKGSRGQYHGETKPFFIDILFRTDDTAILNSISWVSEVRNTGNRSADENSEALYNETITAITIWNNYQCTGRILLDKDFIPLSDRNNRNSEQVWSINKFRNLAKTDVQFLDTLFKNYQVLPEQLHTNLPWFEKRLMIGKYFIVRFEFDNNADKQITLHDFRPNISSSVR